MHLDDIRREYLKGGLNESDVLADPIAQFELWLQQAIDSGLHDPTAMTLATVDECGQPSQRIVLLKDISAAGFVFFTNYGSEKAKNIAVNAKVSVHFPWHSMERQVKVLGKATKISSMASMKYFLSRPKDSQVAAWSSKQSNRVSSRQLLLSQFEKMKEKFAKGEVPIPDFWGGYCVEPEQVEFWQGRASRLHDRINYVRTNDEWSIERLCP